MRHQSSAVLGQQPPDSLELQRISAMLQNSEQRMEGLDLLQAALAKTPARRLLADSESHLAGGSRLQVVFRGLRSCLQVSETHSDALLRVN